MIPKIIHCCWFGSKTFTEEVKSCMDTWSKFLPDFELKIWNEENTTNYHNTYFKQCIREKMYSFASDYIRLCVVRDYGGIYLDTDMHFIKPLPNSVLSDAFFAGYHDNEYITIAVFGAIRNHPLIDNLIDKNYKNVFDFIDPPVLPRVVTNSINDFLSNNPSSLNIYSTNTFYPVPFKNRFESYEKYITEETIAIHVWHYSWDSIYQTSTSEKIGKLVVSLFHGYSFQFVLSKLRKIARGYFSNKRRQLGFK
ncbi:MAG: glycosyltransferase [Bacteroidia bacterium]